MPTTNPRINVVLDKDLYREVKAQAKAQGISLSLKIRDLVAEALNLGEDKLWLSKAEERQRTFKESEALTHEEVWKR
jgi:hypothetical protein